MQPSATFPTMPPATSSFMQCASIKHSLYLVGALSPECWRAWSPVEHIQSQTVCNRSHRRSLPAATGTCIIIHAYCTVLVWFKDLFLNSIFACIANSNVKSEDDNEALLHGHWSLGKGSCRTRFADLTGQASYTDMPSCMNIAACIGCMELLDCRERAALAADKI